MEYPSPAKSALPAACPNGLFVHQARLSDTIPTRRHKTAGKCSGLEISVAYTPLAPITLDYLRNPNVVAVCAVLCRTAMSTSRSGKAWADLRAIGHQHVECFIEAHTSPLGQTTASPPALNVTRRSVMTLPRGELCYLIDRATSGVALCLTLRPRGCRSPTARFAPIVLASRLWPGNPPTFFAPLAPRVAPGAAMPTITPVSARQAGAPPAPAQSRKVRNGSPDPEPIFETPFVSCARFQ